MLRIEMRARPFREAHVIQRFHDRREAGRLLAGKLVALADRPDVIVLGLPRGGVPLACEIAASLRVHLDVFLVRKIGVPGYEELALGAVASGGVKIINSEIVEEFGFRPEEVDTLASVATDELRRSEIAFRGSRPALDLHGRAVVLVDDGIATGSTMRAAIEGVKKLGAKRIVVAAGVMPLSTSLLLQSEVDEVVCILTPRDFRAVGLFYDEFPQLTDENVRALLGEAWRSGARNAA